MPRLSSGFVPKKAHRKSRGGCLRCKTKKVKCDEIQPTCGYCSTRKLSCEYPQNSSSASRSPSSTSSPNQDSEEVNFNDALMQIPTWLVPPAFASSGQLSPLDHDLLHHYRSSSWEIFAIREDAAVHTIHRDFVPQASLSHPYLLHAILSIAASHSNMLRPSKQMERQTLVYRQKTFQGYTKALQNITAENYESILVTGMFLSALIPPPGLEDSDEEHLQWLYSVLKTNEGLTFLASLRWGQGIEKLSVYPLFCRELRTLPPPPPPTVHSSVEDPNLCTLVGRIGTTPDHPNPPPTYQRRSTPSTPLFLPPRLMVVLESLVSPTTTGPIDMHRNALVPVFQALSPIFLSLYYYHLNQDFRVRIFVLTSFLMPDFLDLVKTREPRALTLTAWWFALAGLFPRGWWIGSRVTRVVEAIGRVVRSKGDAQTVEAIKGAEKIVETLESVGREEAARSVFEDWDGMDWDDGPRRAGEWEFEQLLDLSV
ncbi:uncharacterized protein K460DRAFT_352109 [Cucurbitaria berberidis CBS 394.84]|uniref:Zn(2)-C6 fungal-type domain-containing protein n=1 Tax=Cucurbitaria berberidis CBS 394.84 TaxID=1168544 RepID=A0A9P4GKR8_9PLEO|nr:uncharacterized protein K460DRAFT_352109 [Cucurbitaria berberidis CBS 394.84]KAF1846911.1 hypothetical protein K460DRAFT_352109 [Cucurbitaria berberidis CBS 394.84]